MKYEDLESAYNEVLKGEYQPEAVYYQGEWYFADKPLYYMGRWWSVSKANELLRWGFH